MNAIVILGDVVYRISKESKVYINIQTYIIKTKNRENRLIRFAAGCGQSLSYVQ